MMYEIFNNTSGESVGTFEAKNEDEALNAMIKSHEGFDTWQEYVLHDLDEWSDRDNALRFWFDDYQVLELDEEA